MADRDGLLSLDLWLGAGLLGRMLDGLLLAAQQLLAAVFLWRSADGDPSSSAVWCAGVLVAIFVLRPGEDALSPLETPGRQRHLYPDDGRAGCA